MTVEFVHDIAEPRKLGKEAAAVSIASPCSPGAALLTYRRFGYLLALFMLFCSAGQSYSADTKLVRAPFLISSATPRGGGLFTTDNRVDLANEINESVNRLQIANPNISWSDAQDVLIAAYCRVVTNKPRLTAAEKWGRMRQFESVLERQIAANIMQPGTLIIASVPLSPDVYRELKSQAAVSTQTTSQLMAAILTRAAGK